ncbi:hypothetical protein [Breoghania sp. L-A4]|uniref:hypothetical protein n=1 Tax=Breoghania sp. L-A4 TaxID=2304600 RepID=UPI000E35826F|nr:hypothetical protein [Breoghania sp. L-A4]AXS39262.1 hypothetical protein D1F64_03350 [Breoghania sp. L-A4]
MAEKKIRISSPRGLIIPGAVLGKSADVRVGPHEPVSVPVAYGLSLIGDRFAERAGAKPAAVEKPLVNEPDDPPETLPLAPGGMLPTGAD